MVTKWFNIKDRFASTHLPDSTLALWTLKCKNFTHLQNFWNIISSCTWNGGRGRKLKLTNQTGSAFISSAKTKSFNYFLSGINADKTGKFFGQARQGCGGNFIIDSKDTLAVEKVLNLHSLLKYELFPNSKVKPNYPMCQETVDNERILDSDNSQKHKIVYIAGHMVHKYGNISETKMNQIYQNF